MNNAKVISNPLTRFVSLSITAAMLFSLGATSAFADGGDDDKQCETHNLTVNLIPGDPTPYNLVGELCWEDDLDETEGVQLLVHGATYDRWYWDVQHEDDRYSYVDEAIKEDFATFAYDRLGSGESDKPLGVLTNVDFSAYVNSQVVSALRNGDFGESFDTVIQVGHSFGSLISVAAASTYQDVDALVLTGFAHQATAQANNGTGASVYPAAFDPKFAGAITDQTIFTTIPGTRAGLFFSDHVLPELLAMDEAEKDLFALGLVFDIPRHFSTESLAINVPVFMIMGEEDFIYCGEAIDCSDESTFQAHESSFFSVPVETEIVKKAGHSLNLHKNGKKVFKSINDWLEDALDD